MKDMRDIQHTPVLNDLAVLTAPSVTVPHENTLAGRRNPEEGPHMDAGDLAPAMKKGILSVTHLAIRGLAFRVVIEPFFLTQNDLRNLDLDRSLLHSRISLK